jgi:phosphoglycolate/pyridoxal phosphate phosphatase family enzyme
LNDISKKSGVFDATKLFVLDMDGTFYLGDRVLPGALAFLDRLRTSGRRFLFFTNNSSRSPDLYIQKLAAMGCPIKREDIMTSGDVTIRYLKAHYPGKTVYLMGTAALREDFAAKGISLLDALPNAPDASPNAPDASPNAPDARPDVVVVAFDTELTYGKLERACTFIRAGAVFLATHLDINCPTENGFIPDCGAFCAAISLSSGKQPKYLGKPFPETVDMILASVGVAREEIAFVGDRLYTDVAVGVRNGAKGILVLSGETKLEDVAASDVKPDAIFADLGEMARFL